MFSLGLVGRNGEPLHLSTIQGLLKNPFYYGMFIYRGELMQGSHKPMISKKLFDKIQNAIHDNGKPRKKKIKEELIFKNFAVCGECGYKITGERHTKKSGLVFEYYRCTRKSKVKKCTNGFLRVEKLAEQVKDICQKVSIPAEWKDKYLDKISEWEQEESHSSVSFAQNLKNQIKELNTKIDRLTDAYLEEALELSEYHEKKNKLIELKKDNEEKIKDFERKGNHWLEPLKNWVFEANQAHTLIQNIEKNHVGESKKLVCGQAENLVQQENFSGMKIFLKTIGSNRQISNGKLSLNFPKQYNLLLQLYFVYMLQ
jgi:uncharacterized protein YeeX (DUF496 family)